MIIRNQPLASSQATANTIEFPASASAKTAVRSKPSKGSIPFATVASYFGVFLLVVSMIAMGYNPPVKGVVANVGGVVTEPATATATLEGASVDQLMASSIAATIAESADMPISTNMANLSQSLTIESTLAQTDTNVISKPQIVQPTADSRAPQEYTTVAGDTVQLVAQKYGVSATTIKWANKLTVDALDPGKVLTIPPVDGIVYTVRAGDTIDTIASKYKADRDRLIAFNDLELTGNPAVGAQIIIPGGDLPTNEQPGYVAPTRTTTTSSYYGSFASGSVGNRYAWGNCTWYAYERRAQLGRPIGSFWGNAATWAYAASSQGYLVDGNPAPGAIMQNGGGYGHVAIVESANPGVSIVISEMNGYRWGGGFNRVASGEISWGVATSGMYKYIH